MRTVQQMVEVYTEMRSRTAFDSMYQEAMWQYIDMAKGGDGGDLGFTRDGETTCRGINYQGYPDEFFQQVCLKMGWLG